MNTYVRTNDDITQWDMNASLYDKGIGKSGDTLHRRLIDPIITRFVKTWKDKKVLDAGCGNGYLEHTLAPIVKHITGIDASEKLLDFAKSQVAFDNVSFRKANIAQKLPFDDLQFDIIVANMVLQYLPSLTNFAKESSRVLKKNGKLIIIIDHPAHALFLRAQELAGKKDTKFIALDSYFTSGLRKKKSLWGKAELQYYHRPIMYYLNSFSPYFHLEKTEEKSEDGEMPRILGLLWKNSK